MSESVHPSEGERQSTADGSLDAESMERMREHMSGCAACATDVLRLRQLMAGVHDMAHPVDEVDDVWPAIRARIEHSKVVPLPAPRGGAARTGTGRPYRAIGAGVVFAAGLIGLALLMRRPPTPTTAVASTERVLALSEVVDSSRRYEEDSRRLLNELEMQRAMLRPATAASVDRDLFVLDESIAEIKRAIKHDPSDPALRRLLASAFRQKVELLKRVNNAS